MENYLNIELRQDLCNRKLIFPEIKKMLNKKKKKDPYIYGVISKRNKGQPEIPVAKTGTV